MKSQAFEPPDYDEFLTELPNLVERRILLRQELKELDTAIRRAILREHAAGTNISAIAEIVGVSRQRIHDLVSVG